MKKYKIEILGISEVKKKGSGEKLLDNGYVLRYSGVPQGTWAKEGVGIIVSEKMDGRIISWAPVNSRIISMEIDLQQKIYLIQVYGPTEDVSQVNKEQFYTVLQQEVEKAEAKQALVMIIGDLNARVGNNHTIGQGVLERYNGDEPLINNGDMLLNLCIQNQLLIGIHYLTIKRSIK